MSEKKKKMSRRKIWKKIGRMREEQGWNNNSMLELMSTFLGKSKKAVLIGFLRHCSKAQKTENAASSDV